jgi:hypothetical protein
MGESADAVAARPLRRPVELGGALESGEILERRDRRKRQPTPR